MTKMSDLSGNLVAEIQSRVPMTSLRAVRSTCKKWNSLSKNRIFGKSAARRKQFLGFMMMDARVCSMKFDLNDKEDGGDIVDPSIHQVRILNEVEVSKLFQCDGLLLCVIKDNSRLLVWNPYLGQTRWIQPRNNFHRLDRYALGYDSNTRNHKILRFLDDFIFPDEKYFLEYEIYDFSSNAWRVLDVTPDWDILFYQRGVSLKGNTYFFAQEKMNVEGVGDDDEIDTTETEDFLLCFDFTAERFGPRLPLPFHSYYEDIVTLSCVREEQLSVLHQRTTPLATMEIWITTNIEPTAVSWSKFLKVDLRPVLGFKFNLLAGSFFIDQEKKVAVVFDLDGYKRTETCRYQTAYIIGQDGYLKSVNIGEARKHSQFGTLPHEYCVPLVCSSYDPSLVQIIN